MTEQILGVKNLGKQYADHVVLQDVNLSIVKSEFVSLVGMSGGGKSTLLRMIAGLEKPTAGQITQDSQEVTNLNPKVKMMFQDDRLLPWMDILHNVTLGENKDSDIKRALSLLKQVGLEDYISAYPKQISGGQKQRVALARALMPQPEILLLDEPLGALDALTRMKMQDLILQIWEKTGITMILVTHDINEAVRMSQKIFVVKDATIEQEYSNRFHGQADDDSKKGQVTLSAQITDEIMQEREVI
ncbi:ABC transporter ATP-binding protein [Ligilactobacillus acidipiscis]|uniref:ABC transporter ATP-binding protein n=1 Tax=Ligilactobacillus acidipiscis TaxID=89059 RepID=UPI0023F78606|nr:ABC transporter ATP-binding protein [Ligilactobacillus acidipiscis]WEV56615.1 ABC transporter ATP-binding protein [Ligilactobacillus acidipiscis]